MLEETVADHTVQEPVNANEDFNMSFRTVTKAVTGVFWVLNNPEQNFEKNNHDVDSKNTFASSFRFCSTAVATFAATWRVPWSPKVIILCVCSRGCVPNPTGELTEGVASR